MAALINDPTVMPGWFFDESMTHDVEFDEFGYPHRDVHEKDGQLGVVKDGANCRCGAVLFLVGTGPPLMGCPAVATGLIHTKPEGHEK
jgi:hypothetical protein